MEKIYRDVQELDADDEKEILAKIHALRVKLMGEGKSFIEVTDRVERLLTRETKTRAARRARLISRAETSRAARARHMEEAANYRRIVGEPVKIFWNPVDDACPICIEVAQTWDGSGAIPDPHLGCRCVISFE